MRTASLAAALLVLPLAAACGSTSPAAKVTHPRPGLVLDQSIGRVSIGESASRVQYELGMGKPDGGCVLMEEGGGNCATDSYTSKYAVKGGYMRVAFYKGTVVNIETNSPTFKTADGIGVGAHIPYANPKTIDGIRFHYYSPACSCWWGWSARLPNYPQNAAIGSPAHKRWVKIASRARSTILVMDKGKVFYIYVARSDVSFQF